VFRGQDGETRVRCEIRKEALDDDLERRERQAGGIQNQPPGQEEEARRKYLAGRTEADGTVVIRTGDLKRVVVRIRTNHPQIR
jgi:hypothetical protein